MREITTERQREILKIACEKSGLDKHCVFVDRMTDLSTWAARMMHKSKIWYKASYLYLNSVDCCFWISDKRAHCSFSAIWQYGTTDLQRDSYNKAFTLINNMMFFIQLEIDRDLESE